jgi:hypothetical protein
LLQVAAQVAEHGLMVLDREVQVVQVDYYTMVQKHQKHQTALLKQWQQTPSTQY